MSTPPTTTPVLHVYGGISLASWAKTHHEPASWEEGQAIARLLADGGEHKIAALFPAGVALRQETIPARSSDLPVVTREELFPCTRMQVSPIARAPIAPSSPSPTPPPAAAAASPAPSDSLFSGDW